MSGEPYIPYTSADLDKKGPVFMRQHEFREITDLGLTEADLNTIESLSDLRSAMPYSDPKSLTVRAIIYGNFVMSDRRTLGQALEDIYEKAGAMTGTVLNPGQR